MISIPRLCLKEGNGVGTMDIFLASTKWSDVKTLNVAPYLYTWPSGATLVLI